VKIEYSWNNGQDWVLVAEWLFSTNYFEWDSTQFNSSPAGRIRVSSQIDSGIVGTNVDFIAVRNSNLVFYVNDKSGPDDVYCTAPGAPSNLGIQSTAPQDSLQNIFDLYDLEAGDTVYVDTGKYTKDSTITIGKFDAGSMGSPIRILGSTNAARSVVQANFVLSECPGIFFENMHIEAGSGYGLRVRESDYCTFSQSSCASNSYGISLESNSRYFNMQHSILRNNSSGGLNLNASGGSAVISNNLFYMNGAYGIYPRSSGVIENNIFVVPSGNHWAYRGDTVSGLQIDYNMYQFVGATNVYSYTIGLPTAWYARTNWTGWLGQQQKDPHGYVVTNCWFADAAAGDFHLQSTVSNGTYTLAHGWTNFAHDSAAIDTANPLASYANEPMPNGARLNIGPYGNTAQASLGGTGEVLAARFPAGGDIVDNAAWPVVWRANRLPEPLNLTVQWSTNNGANWMTITNADAATEMITWNLNVFMNGTNRRWRVIDTATSGSTYAATNSGPFEIAMTDANLDLHSSFSTNLALYSNVVEVLLTVTNLGPYATDAVQVQSLLTNGLVYVGGGAGVSYNSDTYTLTWDVGTLVDEGFASTVVTARPVRSQTTLTNVAWISNSSIFDSHPENNISTQFLQVASAADLLVQKEVDNPTPTNGQSVVFSLTVYNAGPDAATNKTLIDRLPDGLQYASHFGGDYNPATGEWAMEPLPAGLTDVLYLEAVVTNLGTIVNTMRVDNATGSYDPNTNNNVSTLTINVDLVPQILVLGTNGIAVTNGSVGVSTTNGTDFGAAPTLGGRIEHTFSVTNDGDGLLELTSLGFQGMASNDFSLVNPPQYVGAGMVSNLVIAFTPTAGGVRDAQCVIVNNSGSSRYTFAVQGTGANRPVLQVLGTNGTVVTNNTPTPNYAAGTDLGGVDVVAGSESRTLTVTNAGDALLTIDRVVIGGVHPGDFAVDAWPAGVGIGAASNLTIRFNPVAVGERRATIELVNNSSVTSHIFSVGGTGIVAGIEVLGTNGGVIANGSSLPVPALGTEFGPVNVAAAALTNRFSITNNGGYPLEITGINLGGDHAGDFNVFGLTNVPPGQTAVLTAVFDPSASGVRTAVVELVNNSLTDASYTFVLGGTGFEKPIMAVLGTNGATVASGELEASLSKGTDLGDADRIDMVVTNILTITNSGNVLLEITGVQTGGLSAAMFSIQAPNSVSPGGVSNLVVKFDPSASGVQTAVVTLVNNSADSNYVFGLRGNGVTQGVLRVFGTNGSLIANGETNPVLAAGTAFGEVDTEGAIVTNLLTLTNSGSGALTISAFQVQGSTEFTVTNSGTAVLDAGGSLDLGIRFDPSQTGLREATIVLQNDGLSAPYRFAVSGVGTNFFIAVPEVLGT
ncbi:MAG: choice-of-anchor D domain-containing protein, partial [Kiritimatiellae bacterium]|nr:choice-of-anchor D domain-containing protein [Kiritimatiellia bacterium]